MMNYNNLAECPQFTVVNEYVPDMAVGSGAYESEPQLERRFIRTLEGQGYEYLRNVTSEEVLKENLRRQMEKLNHVALGEGRFTDGEIAISSSTAAAWTRPKTVRLLRASGCTRRIQVIRIGYAMSARSRAQLSKKPSMPSRK